MKPTDSGGCRPPLRGRRHDAKGQTNEWDPESRVRENRMHGLMRGGEQTVISRTASQSVASRLLYSFGEARNETDC